MPKPVMPALKKAQKDDSANKKNLLKNEDGVFGFLKKNKNTETCEDCLSGEEEKREHETLKKRISGRNLEQKKSVLGLSLEKKEEKKSLGFLQKFAFGKEKKEEKKKEEHFTNPVENAESEGVVSVSLKAVIPEATPIAEASTEDVGTGGGLSFADGIVEEEEKDPLTPVETQEESTPEEIKTEKIPMKIEDIPEEIKKTENREEKKEEAIDSTPEKEPEGKTQEKIKIETEEEPKKNSLVSGVLEYMEKETPHEEEEKVLSLSEKLKQKGSELTLTKRKSGSRLLATARFLFLFSFALPISALIIFQTILSENSGLSHALSAKNYGTELFEIKTENEKKNLKMKTLKKDIIQMQQDIDGIRNEKVLTEIADNRIDFLEIMLRINSITLQSLELTPEVNRVIKMLVFNSYSASIDKTGNANVNISGTVRDPKRMSFTKLTTLMETINRDRFFTGANIRSFSKSDDNEGGAKSSFTFNITYEKSPGETSQVAKKTKK